MPALEGHPGLDRSLAACFGLGFAVLALAPSTRLFEPKTAAALGMAAVLFLGAALALAGEKPHAWRLPSPGLGAAWGCAGLAFGAAFLASPYRPVVAWVDPALPCAAALGLGLAAAPRVWGRSLLRAWRWALLATALWALLQRLGWEPCPAYAEAGTRWRATAGFGNADCLAAFLCLGWPLLLAWKGWSRFLGLALVLAALLATQSRAGLLAVVAQVALWAALPRLRRARGGGAGLPPLPGLVLVLALVLALAAWWLFPAGAWLRPTQRLPLWRAGLALWLQRPWLGWGPGAFALAFQDHAPPAFRALVNAGAQYAEAPHQLLLGLACSAGVLGLAVFAGTALFFARLVLASPLAEAPLLGLGALGLLLESQADRFFFSPGVFTALALAGGLLAWRGNEAESAVARGTGSPMGLPTADYRLPTGLQGLPTGFSRVCLSWICVALCFTCAWSAVLRCARSRRGVGASLDSGVGVLASAGDPSGLETWVRTHPKDAQALERLGDALAARHDYAGAAQALGRALALQATPGRAQNLGNCELMLGRLAPAEAAFRLACRLAPGDADAHFSLGYALYYEKRLKESLAELDTALRLDPRDAGAAQLKREILR